MNILVFIIVLGIAIGIFYFFLDRLFGERRLDKVPEESKDPYEILLPDEDESSATHDIYSEEKDALNDEEDK